MGRIMFNWFRKPEEVIKAFESATHDEKSAKNVHLTIENIDDDNFTPPGAVVFPKCKKIYMKRPLSIFVDFVTHVMMALITVAALLAAINFVFDVSNGKEIERRHIYYICVSLTGIITILFYLFEYETQEKRLAKVLKQVTPKFAFVFQGSNKETSRVVVLRIRLADLRDNDYIEMEFDKDKSTYEDLIAKCCEELKIERNLIAKLLKYPETRIRNDADVKRFRRVEYIDVVSKLSIKGFNRERDHK